MDRASEEKEDGRGRAWFGWVGRWLGGDSFLHSVRGWLHAKMHLSCICVGFCGVGGVNEKEFEHFELLGLL